MKTFSFGWSKDLGAAILEAQAPDGPYPLDAAPSDAKLIMDAVNQGIDSHLEACFIPDRGDLYYWTDGGRLRCRISPESLPVLVRRLLESESEQAQNLGACICETLELELI